MATALAGSFSFTGNSRFTNAQDLSVPVDAISIGQNGFDAIAAVLQNGTGATSGNCDLVWHDERTLTATTGDNLDMAGGLTNPMTGATLTFNRIKLIIMAIDAPATGVFLRVGPAVTGASNPWIGPWAQVANNYITLYNFLVMYNATDGWGTITGGSADTFCVYNSTASSITYRIALYGASA